MDLEDLKAMLTVAAMVGLAFLIILVGAGVLGLATVIYKEVTGF